MNIVGKIYLPTQILDIAGGGDVGMASPYFALIADMIVVRGNGQVRVKVDDQATGFPPITTFTLGAVHLTH